MRSPAEISAELEMKLARVEHWERFRKVPSKAEMRTYSDEKGGDVL